MTVRMSRLTVPEMDLTVCQTEGCVWIESRRPWESLSSAVYGGGRRSGIRAVANITVDMSYDGDEPARDIRGRLRVAGVPAPAVGMMTAVDVTKARWAVAEGPAGKWFAMVTAGVRNALCAGEEPGWLRRGPGTVNMIVAYEGVLAEEAAVNAVITLTEVKARVFRERGIRCADSGLTATGTSTDAVAVLYRPDGPKAVYAGPGSEAGHTLARLVHRLLHEALDDAGRESRRFPPVCLVIGGARSGKSEWAEELAIRYSHALGVGVTYVATARPRGMETRIARHRRRRPAGWRTVEAADDLVGRLRDLDGHAGVLLVDCLSLWVAGWLEARCADRPPGASLAEWSPEEEEDLLRRTRELFRCCRDHPYPVIVVTSEVGAGVSPSTPAGCLYRDALGLVNREFASWCTRVYAVVAGIPVDLKALDCSKGGTGVG
ncbi:MAG: bifunctional adenosylcobinamide kinase/adenosylcobinamide-phosphate guanylyltransferase [Alicyclobacillaceae bacterium]|nr:bifunctional adenosylcobinamide kinase/adenosylcobinamide-phosphate guanylyltransferase [Alicyclobacillaceae bacterium]